MDPLPSVAVLAMLVVIAFILARFLLHLAFRVVGCLLTAIVALGILYILIQFLS
jgi:hypothetical protein